MKIALIAPPWIFKEEVEFVSQNLGLGYLASYLEVKGHQITIIDSLIEGLGTCLPLKTKYTEALRWGLSDEEIVNLIPKDSELIGITAPFTDSRFVVNPLSRIVKDSFPGSILVIGGVYPSTLPEEAMKLSKADIVIIGEGEIPLSQIAGGKKWEEIKGIIFRKNGKIVKTGLGETVDDIENNIPMPSYDLRPMRRYTEWSPRGNKRDRTLSIVSSRGCPNKCRFCSIHNVYGRKWRAFSAERILEEIQIAICRFGINHIEFEDDNLTLQKRRAMAIFRGIENLRGRNGEKIYWSAPNGVMIRSLDRELIYAMKESGAELIYLPVESGDPYILKLMNKVGWHDHLQKTLGVIKHCKEVGIATSAFIIVAYPGEDRKSFQKTFDFCKRMIDAGIGSITPLVATPYPNTELYNLCEKGGWLVYPDTENVLIYQRYSHFLPEFVQINTPWCSKEEAFERHQIMMNAFSTKHNIRKGT